MPHDVRYLELAGEHPKRAGAESRAPAREDPQLPQSGRTDGVLGCGDLHAGLDFAAVRRA